MNYSVDEGTESDSLRLGRSMLLLAGLPIMAGVLIFGSARLSTHRPAPLAQGVTYNGYLAGKSIAKKAGTGGDANMNGWNSSTPTSALANSQSQAQNSQPVVQPVSNTTSQDNTSDSDSGSSTSPVLGTNNPSSNSILPITTVVPGIGLSINQQPVVSTSPLSLSVN